MGDMLNIPNASRATQIMDIHVPMALGSSVWFAQPDALKGSLVKTLKEVRPTVFVGVPRVRELRGESPFTRAHILFIPVFILASLVFEF